MVAKAANAAKIVRSDAEWRAQLTPEQYRITRRKGTEPAFSGAYHRNTQSGVYVCVCCGNELFDSSQQFDAGCGWPCFHAAIHPDAVETHLDVAGDQVRQEALCARCDAHLGHVFADGSRPTWLRYCVNSGALRFIARSGT